MITYPKIIIISPPIGICFYLCVRFEYPDWIFVCSIPIGLILCWLYWSIIVTKRRLWAFDNVRNFHELQKKAISKGLIWSDGGFFERTEVRSSDEKAKWLLQQFPLHFRNGNK
jgi:hypothetical protein